MLLDVLTAVALVSLVVSLTAAIALHCAAKYRGELR